MLLLVLRRRRGVNGSLRALMLMAARTRGYLPRSDDRAVRMA